MKFLIVLSCAFAFASAGYSYGDFYNSHHVPVIDHNVAPEDTHEVQIAKAEHLAAHAVASYGGHSLHAEAPLDTPEVQIAKAEHLAAHAVAKYGGHAETPLDTPEVQIAKAEHLAAHAEAKYGGHSVHADAPLDTPEVQIAKAEHLAAHAVASHGGNAAEAPLDTPAVQIAKHAHFVAYHEAAARNSYHGNGHEDYHGHYRKRRDAYYNAPVAGHNGVPVDTPEVQAAKAHHFAAHAALAHHAAPVHYAPQHDYSNHHDYTPHHYTGPQHDHSNHHDYTPHHYTGPIHIPVIDHNGVPVETPEVQHAKAEHLAAHAKLHGGAYTSYDEGHHSAPASEYSSHYAVPAIGHNGTPLDTPEVQAAKAAHFAAHSKAQGHYY